MLRLTKYDIYYIIFSEIMFFTKASILNSFKNYSERLLTLQIKYKTSRKLEVHSLLLLFQSRFLINQKALCFKAPWLN